jgi:hypothetical protein
MRPETLGWAALLLSAMPLPAHARESLGVFDGWATFRDAEPARCYAISEPEGGATDGNHQPYVTIAWWPKQGVRGQLHVRLRYDRGDGRDVMIQIGTRRWRLMPGKADAWSPSARHDAFIMAKIRESGTLTVATRGPKGGKFVDSYPLKGAASALDAAALGCAKMR